MYLYIFCTGSDLENNYLVEDILLLFQNRLVHLTILSFSICRNVTSNDQAILGKYIWPWAKDLVLQHDSYTCQMFAKTRPWPTMRSMVNDTNQVRGKAEKPSKRTFTKGEVSLYSWSTPITFKQIGKYLKEFPLSPV